MTYSNFIWPPQRFNWVRTSLFHSFLFEQSVFLENNGIIESYAGFRFNLHTNFLLEKQLFATDQIINLMAI